jgi:CubicO group peptidase (beta-lactamase class C family)
MTALDLCADWPVDNVSAAVVQHGPGTSTVASTHGDTTRVFRLASLAKPMTSWAVLVAVEEGIVDLDAELPESFAGQRNCTVRHLLCHAGGYPFNGTTPIALPERTRTYSNGGIELAAALVEQASEMTFAEYLRLAVFEPLGMQDSELRGSPAHRVWSTVDNVVRFLSEVRNPSLVSAAMAADAVRVQYPTLAGMVPGVGRFAPCPWGLGFEIRGDKSPHWTGARNSPSTYGHFGGAGTLMWTDPQADVSLIALTDRPFDEWDAEALRHWPQLSDIVVEEFQGQP